ADADDEEQRQLHVVDDVAERVAGLKQAGTLNGHDWPFAAEQQPGGDGHRLALAADADELDRRVGREGGVPGAQLTVRNPDDVGDATLFEGGDDRGTVEHGSSSLRPVFLVAGR